jgi:hypothetical protein
MGPDTESLISKAAGEYRRQATLTGPAMPRRSVCAPMVMAFSLYRRPPPLRSNIMQLLSWLRQRMATQLRTRQSRKRRSPHYRPRLEHLECRWVPSTLRVNHDFNVHAAADTTDPHGTLAWAVANAQNGDTILLTGDVKQTGITLTGSELILTQKNLTIETDVDVGAVTISGGNLSRVFEIASGASVTLDNVIITGGNAVANNPATAASEGGGGGIVVDSGATLMVSGSALSGNSAVTNLAFGGTDGEGGGISNLGTLTVSGSTVSGNSIGQYGRGSGITNYGTLTVSGSTISNNSGGEFGGGIWSRGTLTVTTSNVSGNSVLPFGNGGGIYNDSSSTATITSSMIYGNSAGDYAGGILNAGTMTLIGSTVSGNSAPFGGGIMNAGTMTVSGCTISGNSAGQFGGGIWNGPNGNGQGSTLTISNTTLSGNSATLEGGGIFNDAATVYITNGSTVCGNSAPAGADLYDFDKLGSVSISSDSKVCIIATGP